MLDNPTLTALQQQLACYQKLARLAELQHDCVEQSRTEDLLNILGQRQEVLDQVADLEQVIGPAKRRWSDYLVELAPADRGMAEEMMSETRRLLEKIMSSDKDDSLILQQRKLSVGREIQRTVTAQRASRSYATSAYGQRGSSMDLQK